PAMTPAAGTSAVAAATSVGVVVISEEAGATSAAEAAILVVVVAEITKRPPFMIMNALSWRGRFFLRRGYLVFEMPHAGEDHRQAVFVAGGDAVRVFHRPARLGDGGHAGGGGDFDVVREGEE